ncbi:MAG: SpoIIE family protein phosphatase [Planctomycetaceae bacterium]|nr:SpoIIE family protein phosphatase [Planctomycetaceae bacterium]
MRILVAEDERITRRSLERHLQRWGHEVVCVEDGLMASQAFDDQAFDLVLTDWQMPGIDGLDLIRRIRQAANRDYAYLILLTARTGSDDLVAGLEAGADEFLRKPVEQGELRARLNAAERLLNTQREVSRQAEKMQRNLDAAAKYVESLLPSPMKSPVEADWFYQPANDLAGDSLGYHWIDDTHLAAYVLDVTGHGVDSALLSVTVLNLIRSGSLPDVDFRDSASVVYGLNERFPMEQQGGQCFTIWYGVFGTASRQLAWAGGGHPPALFFSPNESNPRRLTSNGPLIGMLPDWDGKNQQIEVPPESELFILSDGVYEVELSDGTFWTYDEFAKLVAESRSMDNLLPFLWNGAVARCTEKVLDDDFSIVRIRFP